MGSVKQKAGGALGSFRVIELANEKLSFAGKLLGDMGADVVLVEPPEGEPSRGYPPFVDDEAGDNRSLWWLHYNTSKRSVVLDLDDSSDRLKFLKLIETADVLLESEPINRLSALGLDYSDLAEVNPGLIHAAMTTHGRDNPRSDLPATDLTILAEGGPVWSCGYDDHDLPPVRGGGNQGYHTGCHFTAMSVLTALLYRQGGGSGQFLDIAMVACANVTTEAAPYSWLVAGTQVSRQTGRHASTRPSGETQILCADGRHANTGVPPRQPREFAKLLGWLRELGLESELPEAVFLEMGAAWEGPFDLSLIGSDDTVTAIFGAGRDAMKLIAQRSSAQDFFLGCQRAGLSVGPINSPEEAFQDPHFRARGFPVEVEHPEFDRSFSYPGAPYKLHASPWRISRKAPGLGEHTAEIFAQIDAAVDPD